MDFKSLIKRSPLYRLLIPPLGYLMDRQIRREQAKCETQLSNSSLSGIPGDATAVFDRVRRSLRVRGIIWPPRPEGPPLHFLYLAIPGDWERHNIPPQLAKIGEVTTYFLEDRGFPCERDWIETRQKVDQEFPRFVKKLHKKTPVTMMLSYISGAQISAATIKYVSNLGIPTFNIHLDDRASFHGKRIGGHWSGVAEICTAFDLNLTSCPDSIVKYRVAGGEALFWPEGANPEHFRPLGLPFKHDVSFIGQRYGKRPAFIKKLQRLGIEVVCYGPGWETGPITAERMVEVYAQSRINLGFGYISQGSEQCLKGRDFEVPMCGAVYLTSHNKDLERVFRIGEEIEVYRGVDDCALIIRKLLSDEDRCYRIRQNARQASLQMHTWARRVQGLLNCQGFSR